MADDWIKVRANLHSHPKVVRIVSAVCPQGVRTAIGQTACKCMVIGALHAAWCLFDTHSIDGRLDGYSRTDLDQTVGIDGFADAMELVGWLTVAGNCLQMRDFDAHNGKGAKRRAENTKARGVSRMSAACPQNDRTDCGPEKRREDSKTPLPPQAGATTVAGKPRSIRLEVSEGFATFWARWPESNRSDKPRAWGWWVKYQLDDPARLKAVLDALAAWKRSAKWQNDGGRFVPKPAAWIRRKDFMLPAPEEVRKVVHE